jgi:pantoate--beta-alanine ligase
VKVARTVVELRAALAPVRAAGRPVAVVPTMGALHEGHLSLIRLAARDGHAVVMTLFVNPAQFAEGEDLSRYPRDEERDLALAAEEGVALVFAPGGDEVYPPGFATRISVGGPALGLEGAARPGHFDGVATVVAKLLLAVRPDRAVFGQKDAQQAAVVRRLLRDLHLDDIELVLGPIVREPDGLAMSSRNAYLDPDDRRAATALSRGLEAAAALVADGERDAARVEAAARAVIEAQPRCALDYAAVVDPDTFAPLASLEGPALLAVAARVGPARLIDNVRLPSPTRRIPVPPPTRTMLKSTIHRATAGDAERDHVGVPASGERR